MREPVGVCESLLSITFVSAKLKPPMSASQSGKPCGRGHDASGAFSTISTPAMAMTSRSSDAAVGFSPSNAHATSTDHAGIK